MPEIRDPKPDNSEPRDPKSSSPNSDSKGSGPGGPGAPGGGDGNMRFSRSMLGWILILTIAVLIIVIFHERGKPLEEIPYSKYRTELNNRHIEGVEFKDDGVLAITFKDGVAGVSSPAKDKKVVMTTRIPMSALDGAGWDLMTREAEFYNAKTEYKNTSNFFLPFLFNVAPWILFLVLIYFLFLRQLRGGGGGMGMLGNFGRSRHKLLSKEHTNVTFNDVAGIEEAKEELEEIVQFLKNPKRFQKLGGRIPRGVLLIGEPGVGKTLLAKAIAGEADVPFFSISGSDFVEMFVGVGASRVRDLFKTAKESSPCIIFLDEIDAVGRRRGNGMASGGHDEREQTLNAILVEMDGFDTNDQVIVIAATNRNDVLDPALTRPGRFDRQVFVPLPDIKGRYEILKVHAKKVKLATNVDLMRLARQTPMFSGADLAAIINEAALLATMSNKEAIEMNDLEESRDKLRFGKARKSRVIDEKEKEIVAWHEAGHAVVQSLETEYDPLHKVSIISRGRMGGAAFTLPEKDRMFYGKKYWLAYLRICYGGRVAEQLYCGDIGTGASMDIQQASAIARAMVREWGMSEVLGPVKFTPEENTSFMGMESKQYSDKTADLIDQEVRQFITNAYEQTREILSTRGEELRAVKDALLKYETLDAEDVRKILGGQTISKPTVSDILAQEQQRRAELAREQNKTLTDADASPASPIPHPG